MARRSSLIVLTCVLAVASLPARGAPSSAPASRPSTGPVAASRPAATMPTALDRATEKKILGLTRRAIELMEQHKLDEAEPVLRAALKLDPAHTTNLYNFACLLALQGKQDEAMDELEKAGDSGWTDFVHMGRDPDLASLRDLRRYKAFVARKNEVQQRAAEKALAQLKRQFGDGYLYEVDADRKLIFATNVDAATLAELKAALKAQSASQWEELFANRPDDYVSVVVPSAADYRKIVRMPGVGGFYNDAARILVVRRLGQTVTHEFTHALHAADRAPLGQDHPIWLGEGLASLYEAATYEGERLVPHDNFRLRFLQNAAKGHKLIPLKTLLEMDQPAFVAKANLAYGQASSVLLYLYERKLLRPFYDAYKKAYDAEPTGRAALEKVAGQSLDQFEKAWTAWMVKRPPVPTDTGADGVVIGAVLGDANDGLAVRSVLRDGPADKAGVRGGDVIVGLGDVSVRDPDTFYPTLIRFKPGDEVKLKVRRDDKYVELPVVLARRSAVADGVMAGGATRPAGSGK